MQKYKKCRSLFLKYQNICLKFVKELICCIILAITKQNEITNYSFECK